MAEVCNIGPLACYTSSRARACKPSTPSQACCHRITGSLQQTPDSCAAGAQTRVHARGLFSGDCSHLLNAAGVASPTLHRPCMDDDLSTAASHTRTTVSPQVLQAARTTFSTHTNILARGGQSGRLQTWLRHPAWETSRTARGAAATVHQTSQSRAQTECSTIQPEGCAVFPTT